MYQKTAQKREPTLFHPTSPPPRPPNCRAQADPKKFIVRPITLYDSSTRHCRLNSGVEVQLPSSLAVASCTCLSLPISPLNALRVCTAPEISRNKVDNRKLRHHQAEFGPPWNADWPQPAFAAPLGYASSLSFHHRSPLNHLSRHHCFHRPADVPEGLASRYKPMSKVSAVACGVAELFTNGQHACLLRRVFYWHAGMISLVQFYVCSIRWEATISSI